MIEAAEHQQSRGKEGLMNLFISNQIWELKIQLHVCRSKQEHKKKNKTKTKQTKKTKHHPASKSPHMDNIF